MPSMNHFVRAMVSMNSLFIWAVASPVTSLAQSPEPEKEPPLINAVVKTLKGRLIPPHFLEDGSLTTVPESCRFTVSLPPDGPRAIQARRMSEININRGDHSCDALFEVGEPPAEARAAPVDATNSSKRSSAPIGMNAANPGDASGSTPSGLPSAPGVESAGFLKTWWIDPLFITVNSVQNSTDWRWSAPGICVAGLLGGEDLYWLTLSGWELLSDNWQNYYECTATTSRSTTLYLNSIFCLGDSTYALYAPNMVNGLDDGTLAGTWDDTVYGSICINLLSFRMQLERTLN